MSAARELGSLSAPLGSSGAPLTHLRRPPPTRWNQIALYVALNTPASSGNGVVQLWYDGVQAFKFDNVQLRTADSLSGIGGIFFS